MYAGRSVPSGRPRVNQPTGFRGYGNRGPTYYYGHRHDYIFFPTAWVDEATGRSYEKGYYDENGQYYPNVAFEKDGRFENVLCHCPYCGQDSLISPSTEQVTARNLECPNCGAPMEIRSELDSYRTAAAGASFTPQQGQKKRRRWLIPVIIIAILAVLGSIGNNLEEEEPQQIDFQMTNNNSPSDTDLFGKTIYLVGSGGQSFAITSNPADKKLVWDSEYESYYDADSDCWLWYNTDVEPPVWQYWYEGISSDYGDYGWMEHDEDGWWIEASYGNWIQLPASYDSSHLWFISE